MFSTIRNYGSRALLGLAYAIAGGSERRSNDEDPTQPLTFGNLHNFWGGGKVTHAKALGYAPLYQGVNMVSGDCSKLPLNVYQKTSSGRSVLDTHKVHKLIKRTGKPNLEINGQKFWKRFYASASVWGNGYAWIDRSNGAQVLGLYQLLPDRTWMERVGGRLVCKTQTSQGTKTIDNEDVLHVEGLCIDGVSGLDVIELFRKDFTIALSAKDFAVQFFKNNMTAGGILQARPGTKPATIRKMQKRIEENFSGSDNAFKTIVMRDNFQWFSTQVDPEKAQLSSTREDLARDVARILNIPPSRLGLKDSTSYNSEEAAKQNYFDGALSHMLIATSCEATTKLLSEKERDAGLYIEHNINALLWADSLTRSIIANSGIQSGRFSPNETRAWENADSYDGGDNYYMPLNVQAVSKRSRRKRKSSSPLPVSGRGAGGEGLSIVEQSTLVNAANLDACRHLAKHACERATNRALNKLNRGKSIESDRPGIIDIVDTTMRQIGLLLNRDCSQVAQKWFNSISRLDATSLSAQAETSFLTILEETLK